MSTTNERPIRSQPHRRGCPDSERRQPDKPKPVWRWEGLHDQGVLPSLWPALLAAAVLGVLCLLFWR
jgi:hypothetical protein